MEQLMFYFDLIYPFFSVLMIYILSLFIVKSLVNFVLSSIPSVAICGLFRIKRYTETEGIYIAKIEGGTVRCIDNDTNQLQNLEIGKKYFMEGEAKVKLCGIIIPRCCFRMLYYKIK